MVALHAEEFVQAESEVEVLLAGLLLRPISVSEKPTGSIRLSSERAGLLASNTSHELLFRTSARDRMRACAC